MSESELRSQISAKQDEIAKIEADAAKKREAAEAAADTEYDGKISDADSKVGAAQGNVDKAIGVLADWKAKIVAIKPKVKIGSASPSELTDLKGKMGDAKAKLGEAKGALKAANGVKKGLVKEKSSSLKAQIKEINVEAKTKIKAVNVEIKAINREIKAIIKAASM